jgi:diguanylate cyclase (GGDEF)-like protein
MEDERIKELQIVVEFVESIFLSNNLDILLQKSADFFMNKFKLSNCSIQLNGKKHRFYSEWGANKIYDAAEERIYNAMKELKTPLIMSSLKDDFLTKTVENIDKVAQSLLAIPIVSNRELIGSINIYSEGDLKHLLDTASAISQKLEKASLLIKRYDDAQQSAVTDSLTGLYNRAYMFQFLEKTIQNSTKDKKPTSVIMFDIDNFKIYNDTQGHLEGDNVLRKIAQVSKKCFRADDVVARFGGEEFTVILPETDSKVSKDRAEEFCKKVLEESKLSISVGLLSCLNSSISAQESLKLADEALYKAKNTGKNRVVQFIVVDKNLGVIDTVHASSTGR